MTLSSEVPLPFGYTFALLKPSVASVSPACVVAGNTFTIDGTGVYPSLVTSVLIGGTPLDSTQFTTDSDTVITAVAAESVGEGPAGHRSVGGGLSNSNVTMKIAGTCGS